MVTAPRPDRRAGGVTVRAGALLLAMVAPAATIAVDLWGWYPFGPVKVLAVSVLGAMGAALVLRGRGPRLPSGLGRWLTVLVTAMAVAAWFGEEDLYAWVGTPERRFGVVTWALCAVLLAAGSALGGAPALRRLLAVGLVAAGLGLGGFATAEALGWEPAVFDVASRLTGTMGSAAYLGAASALLLPVAAGVALDRDLDRNLRWVGALAAIFTAVALLGSGARAAWFGVVLALVMLAVARRSWLTANAPLAVMGAAVAAVVLVLVAAATPVGDRVAALKDPDAPGGAGRLDEWRVAVAVLGEHPLLGVGPEGYRIAFHKGVDVEYEREHGRAEQPDRAHSVLLDVALAGGVPGLLAWLAAMIHVARAVWRGMHLQPWMVGLAVGLAAHWIGQLFLFPVVEIEPWAWLSAGLLIAAGSSAPGVEPGRSPDGRLPASAWLPPRRTADPSRPRAASLLLGVGAVAALGAGVTDVVADHRARAAADALRAGDVRTAAREAEAAVDLRPDVVRLHVLAATARVADAQGTLSGIRQLDDALEVSPGDPIALLDRVIRLVDRAVATLVPEHAEAAQAELDRLLSRDEHNAALWWQARRLAELRGDEPAARRAHQRWLALTPPDRRNR